MKTVRRTCGNRVKPAPQQLNGPVVLVRDNLNTHISCAMRELAAARVADDLPVPPYASELNPVEAVWSNLKRSLADLTEQNIEQLTALVKPRFRRMQYRPGPRRLSDQDRARL